jgi:hypothetical protein
MTITLEVAVKGGSSMNPEAVRRAVQGVLAKALKGQHFTACVRCVNGEPEGNISMTVA